MHSQTLAWSLAAALCLAPLGVFAQSAPAVTEPQDFAEKAASSNMFEIQSSQLALDHASNDDVRGFAQQMVKDHTEAGEKMKAAAAKDGVTTPTAMMQKDASQLDELKATPAADFDKAYVAAQTAAHDQAVALFKGFSTDGKESALRDFAAETLPVLEQHQKMVHELAEDD